jgi:hypothetical protein
MKISTKIIAIALVIGGLLTVFAPGLSDYAKTPVGWTIWDILTGVGVVLFAGGIVLLATKSKSE